MISPERAFIIDSSLKIERNLSILLANILYISDIDKSKILGNKSTAFSFNTKADILLDTEYISDENRKKFQLFMEIRNQFAHNVHCDSYRECLNIVKDCEKKINKFYPSSLDNESSDEKLHLQFINFIEDLNSIINECHSRYINRLEDFITREFQSNLFEVLNKSIINNIVNIKQLIDFPISDLELNKLKENLIKKIFSDSKILLQDKMPEMENKVSKRKLKNLE